MSQLQNYTVAASGTVDMLAMPRHTISATVIGDNGVSLGVQSFTWPDVLKNMTVAQRQAIAEKLAPAILRFKAGLDPEL